MDERWQEIKAIWKQNQWLYVLAGFALGVLFFPMLQALAADAGAFLQSLVPEAVGIVFTVLLIDGIYQRREENAFKTKVLREFISRANDIALQAADTLRDKGWLFDGSLHGSGKKKAYEKANLQNANLIQASLQGIHLVRCDLAGADLTGADLRGAYLYHSNLQNATLNASGIKAKFDENTMLPDAIFWTPDTDMRRFTDPEHPQFWRSDDPSSPAYRGRGEE